MVFEYGDSLEELLIETRFGLPVPETENKKVF